MEKDEKDIKTGKNEDEKDSKSKTGDEKQKDNGNGDADTLNSDYLMGGFKSCGFTGSGCLSVDAGPYPEVLARFINDPRGGMGDRMGSNSNEEERYKSLWLYNVAAKFKHRVLHE